MSVETDQAKDLSFTVNPEQAGMRLDVFLAQADESFSRSQIKYAIEEGDVSVNGKEPKVSQHLKSGDVVQLHLEPAIEATAVPQETSGLIVAAKTDESHRRLSAQFEMHEVHKKYIALVWGDVKGQSGEIVLPVGRHPGDRKKMSTKSRHGKNALTLWKVCERYGTATLLDIEIKTGRTHQIRVHLSERGYPVIGDAVYGNPSKINIIKNSELKALSAQGLAAFHVMITKA
ncbi:MAG: hypothetical protein CVU51_14150 [Deltaproteobacteria bacterium HGW-Deltaproteobacteria-1]|nr:MAG: hypothetical protein CVU51_14150 [Deltaproteobacteria bacterium HGW-Deltaproteobacteria-1]